MGNCNYSNYISEFNSNYNLLKIIHDSRCSMVNNYINI